MILTGTRRLLELPIQPKVDGAPMPRLCPAQLFIVATLLCVAGEFTAVATLATAMGFAVIGTTGMCSQLRRPERPTRIASECPVSLAMLDRSSPATRIGLASLLLPPRTLLVNSGDLSLLLASFVIAGFVGAGLVVAIIAAAAGADWLFEPGPVTDVRVSTTLLPV